MDFKSNDKEEKKILRGKSSESLVIKKNTSEKSKPKKEILFKRNTIQDLKSCYEDVKYKTQMKNKILKYKRERSTSTINNINSTEKEKIKSIEINNKTQKNANDKSNLTSYLTKGKNSVSSKSSNLFTVSSSINKELGKEIKKNIIKKLLVYK